ncbi:MAG: adenylyl-sulfate kinase [Chlorobium sp.]|nr:MAG: adenylyl-sulfate kinase [Chlorobium sp.]
MTDKDCADSGRGQQNIHWHRGDVAPSERAALKSQQPTVIWLTGLSGSGKSTLANRVERRLLEAGRHTMLMDADNIRHGLCRDLGFSEGDRAENIRRIGEVSKLMAEAGLIVITAFISPFRADRDMVRTLLPAGAFIEVHLSTSLEVCEARDAKGLYRKARKGEIAHFTGISSPYEAPRQPELRIDTATLSEEESCDLIMNFLYRKRIIDT